MPWRACELPESVVREAGRYQLHPALGDALLQSMAGACRSKRMARSARSRTCRSAFAACGLLRRSKIITQPLFTYAVRTSSESSPSPERVEANVYLVDAAGDVLVALEGVQVQRLGRSGGGDAAVDTSRWLYRVAWQEAAARRQMRRDAARDSDAARWLIFADARGVGRQLAERLAAARRGERAGASRATNSKFAGASPANGQPARTARPRRSIRSTNVIIAQLLDEAFVGEAAAVPGRRASVVAGYSGRTVP